MVSSDLGKDEAQRQLMVGASCAMAGAARVAPVAAAAPPIEAVVRKRRRSSRVVSVKSCPPVRQIGAAVLTGPPPVGPQIASLPGRCLQALQGVAATAYPRGAGQAPDPPHSRCFASFPSVPTVESMLKAG